MLTLEVAGYTAIALTVLMIPLALNVSIRRFTLGKARGDIASVSIGALATRSCNAASAPLAI